MTAGPRGRGPGRHPGPFPGPLPKVELHLHLDCSLSYDLVSRLDPSVTPAEYRAEFVAPARCRDLADLIARADREIELLQDATALRLAVLDLLRQLEADGVVYAEIRFAPLLHAAAGLSPERAVAAVDAAAEEGCRGTGLEARILLCCLRHFTETESLETARLAVRFRGSRVVGLDLAGDEAGHPIAPHVPAFRHAAEHGVARTAHAGEARGPESVRETLGLLDPSRIGHGVRSHEDPALVRRLRAEGIHLEVCPTSNLQIGIAETIADHPVDALRRAGVSLGINTDGRTLSGIDLAHEYAALEEAFGWEAADFLACNRAALDAAFISEEVREPLRARLEAGYRASPPRPGSGSGGAGQG